jgi:hypothetical protein
MPCIPSVHDVTSLYPEGMMYLEMHCIYKAINHSSLNLHVS